MSEPSQATLPSISTSDPSVATDTAETKEDKMQRLFTEATNHYLEQWEAKHPDRSDDGRVRDRIETDLKTYLESDDTFVTNRRSAGVEISDNFSVIDMINMDNSMYHDAEVAFKRENPKLDIQLRDHLITSNSETFRVQVDPIATDTEEGKDYDGTGYKGVGLVKKMGHTELLYTPHPPRRGALDHFPRGDGSERSSGSDFLLVPLFNIAMRSD